MNTPAESTSSSETPERIPVGVSSCLLGEAIRYDGGHKHDRYVTGVLGRYFEYVPRCPEALAGLGVPRPPIRLAGDPDAPRAVRVADASADVTDALLAAAHGATPDMGALRGYIFKRGSPSCGMASIAGGEPTARNSSTRTVQDDGTGRPSVPSHATPRKSRIVGATSTALVCASMRRASPEPSSTISIAFVS